MSEEKKLNGTVIVTYRCNARCSMCNRYKAPSKPEEEISIETIKKLPKMYFTNITGGEPFIRTDLKDIVRELYKKSDRIVISTNGFFTDRIVDLCKEFPQIGIRISIEGLEQTNNEIRGLQNGYQRGYGTLKKLREMGMKDVGFGMTVQDKELLMRQIMEAGFAMDDVALFLDTHPENQDALRYYKAVRDMRDQSMAAYERRFGPLRYTDVTSMSWNWVTEKWPWEGGC